MPCNVHDVVVKPHDDAKEDRPREHCSPPANLSPIPQIEPDEGRNRNVETEQPDQYDDREEASDRTDSPSANCRGISVSVLHPTNVKDLSGIGPPAADAVERVSHKHEYTEGAGCP